MDACAGGSVFVSGVFCVETAPLRGVPVGGPVGDMIDPLTGEQVTPRIFGELSLVVTEPVRFVVAFARSTIAVVVLVALVIGPPLDLTSFIGWPLPTVIHRGDIRHPPGQRAISDNNTPTTPPAARCPAWPNLLARPTAPENHLPGSSTGKPPAWSTSRFTFSARARRGVWHGLISLHVLMMPITGLPCQSSES